MSIVDYREILRLQSLGHNITQIAGSLHSSRNTVREIERLADVKGIRWSLREKVTNPQLYVLLYPERQECNSPDALSLRDKMILMILYNTGCRVSELVNLCVSDISIETDGTSSIRFWGKGRKERITPIWKSTAAFINNYIKLQNLNRDNRLLSNNRKGNLTRSGIGQRITTTTEKAAELSPALNKKNVAPHTFRHSAAMNLLQAGVDISTTAI